jgi:hypothetical protein
VYLLIGPVDRITPSIPADSFVRRQIGYRILWPRKNIKTMTHDDDTVPKPSTFGIARFFTLPTEVETAPPSL